jgi:PIN domain nuclease of toxin-antitoxin system
VILLDTHIWLDWIIRGPDSLPQSIRTAIASDELAVSAISCFEVAMLAKKGTIDLEVPVADWLHDALAPSGVACIPVSCEIAELSVCLPPIHKDPSDRLIIATAICANTHLASKDRLFPLYPELGDRLISEKS